MIIGITGLNGSGKGTVAEFFKAKGFKYNSCSDVLRDEAEILGLPQVRDTWIMLGEKFRKEFGKGALGKKMLDKIKSDKQNSNQIVDSIRVPEEVLELRKNKSFILIGVVADQKVRFGRIKLRSRGGEEKLTLAEFIAKEEKEMNSTTQNIPKCIEISDIKVNNDHSVEELNKELEVIYRRIIKK